MVDEQGQLFASIEAPAACWDGGAVLSTCGTYRYTLTRPLTGRGGPVVFALANPSVADHKRSDPTLRKSIGFAARVFDASEVRVVNPYAYRTPSPRELFAAHCRGVDVIGPDNEAWVARALEGVAHVVVGWGACLRPMPAPPLASFVEQLALAGSEEERTLWCFGTTRRGEPRHPLMLAYTTPLESYPWRLRHP